MNNEKYLFAHAMTSAPEGILGNPKPGYIYKENHHIAIDCGCNRRNGRLAAVCLETGQEYYVEKS